MTMREKVARAVVAKQMENRDVYGFSLEEAAAAITAFLEAAAEEGWRMCRVKATEEMDEAGLDDPKADYCDQCMQAGHTRNSGWPGVIWDAMLAASPKFEWDR